MTVLYLSRRCSLTSVSVLFTRGLRARAFTSQPCSFQAPALAVASEPVPVVNEPCPLRPCPLAVPSETGLYSRAFWPCFCPLGRRRVAQSGAAARTPAIVE